MNAKTQTVERTAANQRTLGRGVLTAAAGIVVLALANPAILNGATFLGYGLLLVGLLVVARSGR